MSKTVHYIGLDVHKETIAVAIAPAGDTEVRHYGVIGGKVADIDNLIKKLQKPGVELHFIYEAGPCGYVIYRHLANDQDHRPLLETDSGGQSNSSSFIGRITKHWTPHSLS